jgi:hypothetical protein
MSRSTEHASSAACAERINSKACATHCILRLRYRHMDVCQMLPYSSSTCMSMCSGVIRMLFSIVDFYRHAVAEFCCIYWRRKERSRCCSWPFHMRCCAFEIPIAALTLDAIRCGSIHKVFPCLNTMLCLPRSLHQLVEPCNTIQIPVTFVQTA